MKRKGVAYDEALAAEFREVLDGMKGISEKKMMGGVCFFLNGNMIGGADRTKSGDGRFMFRVGKDNEVEALSRPGAEIVEQGGRRLGGMVFVDEAYCERPALDEWVSLSLSFVSTLPAK